MRGRPSAYAGAMTEDRVRVVLCDDSMGFRALLRSWLLRDGRFDVVGAAESGAAVEAVVAVEAPELLVLDLVLPDVEDVPALVERLRAGQPALRVVMMSSLQTGELEQAAEAAAADGFAHKATTAPALCALLHRVARAPRAPVAG